MLPSKSIHQAYEQILSKSKEDPMVRMALSIVLAATRPLTLPEMNIAVNIDGTARSVYEAVVKPLLMKGANLESRDKRFGRTPLLWAASQGHEAILELLIVKGADPESKEGSGLTPLSFAAMRGSQAMVKQLLGKGADSVSLDRNDQTPLSRAVSEGHEAVINLLREKGASLDPKKDLIGQDIGDMDRHV